MYWSLLWTHLVFYWGTSLVTQIWEQERASLDFFEIVPLVLFNQLVVSGGIIWVMDVMGYELDGEGYLDELLDWGMGGLTVAVWRFSGAVLVMNFAFFVLHRIAHKWRWMYRKIHTVHHQLVVNVGYGAVYCHLVEHLLVNVAPILLGVWYMLESDWWLIHAFVAFVSVETVLEHTAYVGKGSEKGSRHYLHHFKRGCNYGNGPYLEDKLFGTFRDWTGTEIWDRGGERERGGERRREVEEMSEKSEKSEKSEVSEEERTPTPELLKVVGKQIGKRRASPPPKYDTDRWDRWDVNEYDGDNWNANDWDDRVRHEEAVGDVKEVMEVEKVENDVWSEEAIDGRNNDDDNEWYG